jgi:hypothetical protein
MRQFGKSPSTLLVTKQKVFRPPFFARKVSTIFRIGPTRTAGQAIGVPAGITPHRRCHESSSETVVCIDPWDAKGSAPLLLKAQPSASRRAK